MTQDEFQIWRKQIASSKSDLQAQPATIKIGFRSRMKWMTDFERNYEPES